MTKIIYQAQPNNSGIRSLFIFLAIAGVSATGIALLSPRGTLQDVPPDPVTVSSTPVDFDELDPPQITDDRYDGIELGSAQKDIAANYRLIPSDNDTDTDKRRIRLAMNPDGSGVRFEFLASDEGWVLAAKSWL